MHQFRVAILWSVLLAVLAPASALSQPASRPDERAISGTVVSSTRNSLVLRSDSGQFQLFVFDDDSTSPRTLPAGARVNVVSTPGDEEGYRFVTSVTTSAEPAGTQPGNTPQRDQPVPPTIRRLERDIERQVRRFRMGVRAGAALDPELILAGVHASLGPFFNPDITFRPNAEFAFGEVTTLFALNLEAIYRLPLSPRRGRWSVYVGAGPGFSFIDQNFERTQGEERDIDFDDFDFDAGLNILTGVEFRNGMFMELKSSVYAVPHIRMIVGFNF